MYSIDDLQTQIKVCERLLVIFESIYSHKNLFEGHEAFFDSCKLKISQTKQMIKKIEKKIKVKNDREK